MKKNDKPTHSIEDSLLVEYKAALNVNLKDLGLDPLTMSESFIKKIIAYELDRCIRESFGITTTASQLTLLDFTTKSYKLVIERKDDTNLD